MIAEREASNEPRRSERLFSQINHATRDALATIVLNNPNGLILDFFAGGRDSQRGQSYECF